MARKAVPYSGPDAPPTRDTSVVPIRTSRSPTVAASYPASASVTAAKPRFMLTPWSASPIAESSWVR